MAPLALANSRAKMFSKAGFSSSCKLSADWQQAASYENVALLQATVYHLRLEHKLDAHICFNNVMVFSLGYTLYLVELVTLLPEDTQAHEIGWI